jgi:hypothetical protein
MAKSRLDAYSRLLDDTPSHPKAASGPKQRRRKIRNPKSETNSKSEIRISKTPTRTPAATVLGVLDWSAVF